MNYKEILESLSLGQKVRKINWPIHEYFEIRKGVFYSNNPNRVMEEFGPNDEFELFHGEGKIPDIVFHMLGKFVFFSQEGSADCLARDQNGYRRIRT